MRERFLKTMLVLSVLLVAAVFVANANAQCVACTGPGGPGQTCITAASGWSSCTTSPDPDIGCKVSCPGCPDQPCDTGGGGGGGGGCDGTGFSQIPVTGDESVVTTAVIFETDAATNAHLFGGRGQGYRILSGAAVAGFDAQTAARVLTGAVGPGSDVRLAFAITNINEAGIPTTIAARTGEAFTFAPRGEGSRANVQFRVRGANKLARAIEAVALTPNDVLLVDVQAQGKAYVLVLRSESFHRSAADFAQRIQAIQDALRQSVQGIPRTSGPSVFILPVC